MSTDTNRARRVFAEGIEHLDCFLDCYKEGNDLEYSDFYVGITNDVERRLFEEHELDEQSDDYESFDFESVDLARKAERVYLNQGLKGDTGGGNEDSSIVYIYFDA
ncbi:MAG: hypothetical protein OXG08_00435 [Gammaproteobacteria bacterium]|nr:hypothetical protein [Gammaproteobacteria bacterium]